MLVFAPSDSNANTNSKLRAIHCASQTTDVKTGQFRN
jgi:hypothetical protein